MKRERVEGSVENRTSLSHGPAIMQSLTPYICAFIMGNCSISFSHQQNLCENSCHHPCLIGTAQQVNTHPTPFFICMVGFGPSGINYRSSSALCMRMATLHGC